MMSTKRPAAAARSSAPTTLAVMPPSPASDSVIPSMPCCAAAAVSPKKPGACSCPDCDPKRRCDGSVFAGMRWVPSGPVDMP